MALLKNILNFILLLLICESVALSAVSWSFLESARSAFHFVKVQTDNRVRDTLLALAKAAEGRMTKQGLQELNLTFIRLVKRSEEDVDEFRIKEVVLLSPKGVILAHSDPERVQTEVRKRKADATYSSELFERALRLRKWQISNPVIYGKERASRENSLIHELLAFFPELTQPTLLLSSAVFQEDTLEQIGSIHIVFERGNFWLFLEKQVALYKWMFFNYAAIGFISALVLGGILLLLSLVWKERPQKLVLEADEKSPELFRKVEGQEAVFSEEELPESEAEPLRDDRVIGEREASKSSNSVRHTEEKQIPHEIHNGSAEVLDAIYLGEKWN